MSQKQTRIRRLPQRSCIICRQKTDKQRLIRLVRTQDQGIVVDPTGKRNGRGAYLCDRTDCWKEASLGKRLAQALAAPISQAEITAILTHRPSAAQS